jgi:tetratricopeptide (TPR) repeat protein
VPDSLALGSGSAASRAAALGSAAVLVLLVAVAYAGAYRGVIVFDDELLTQPASAGWLPEALLAFGGKDSPYAGRPLTAASFLLEAQIFGRPTAVGEVVGAGSRSVGLAIHAAAALALCALLRRSCARVPALAPQAAALAFAAAALWAVHPVQTAAVTYVSQRAETLAGLCTLLSLLALARSAQAERPQRWWVAMGLASGLAAAAKETGAVVPLLLFLYDRAFLGGGPPDRARARRCAIAVTLAITWLLVGVLVASNPRPRSVAFERDGLTPLSYLLTQAEALLLYVRLIMWPTALQFDFGWPVVPVTSAADLGRLLPRYGPPLLATGLGFAVSAWAALRRPRAGFLAAAWFLLLAPSSSLLPIATEILALHRLYLPSAALITGLVIAAFGVARARWLPSLGSPALVRGAALAVLAAMLAGLVAATRHENALFASEIALWTRDAERDPGNPRALLSLGLALGRAGQQDEAIERLEQAVAASLAIEVPRHPLLPLAVDHAGVALRRAGHAERATHYLRWAVELSPDQPRVYLAYGSALAAAGQLEAAADAQRTALARFPDFAEARWNLVAFLLQLGRLGEAETEALGLPGVSGDRALARRAVAELAVRLGRPLPTRRDHRR